MSTDGIEGTALALIGTRRTHGGKHPDTGFDCSGFAQYVFYANGINIPPNVASQWATGRGIDDVKSGDLVFFDIKLERNGPTHVGISLNWPQFIHVSSQKNGVALAEAGPRYWTPRYVGARRYA